MLKLLIALAAVMPLLAQNATVLRIVPSSAGIGEARWYDADASHYVGFKSNATVSTSVLWSLPNADGAASECLVTDGSLSLSFAACAAGSTPPFATGTILASGTASYSHIYKTADAGGNAFTFDVSKARGSIGSETDITAGDDLGTIQFSGWKDGSQRTAASIMARVEATATSQTHGTLLFRTTNGSANLGIRWTITKDGGFIPGANETYHIGSQATHPDTVFGRRWESYDGAQQRIVLNSPGSGSNTGSAITVKNAAGTNIFSLSYGGTLTLTNLTVQGNQALYGYHEFEDADQSNYVRVSAPNTVSSNYSFTLPVADCVSGDFLKLTSGVMLCGTPTGGAPPFATGTNLLDASAGDLGMQSANAAATAAALNFRKARGSSGSPTDISANDDLGHLQFNGYRTTNYKTGASVHAIAEAVGTNVVQGKLLFATSNASGTSVDRWSINKDGHLSPTAALSYDIGSTTLPVGITYTQQAKYNDGTFDRAGFKCCTGTVFFYNDASNNVKFSVSTAGSLTAVNSITTDGPLTFGTSSAFLQGATTRIDGSGNGALTSLSIGGTSTINSSRQWVPTSFLFATDGSSSIGSSSANRPGTIHVGAGTAGGTGVLVYNGSVLRIRADAAYISLFNNSSSEVLRLDSSTGDIIFTGAITQTATSRISSGGVFNGASYNVGGTEIVSSGRIGKFVSLDINGTTDRINSSGVFNAASYSVAGTSVVDSSRNASFVSLTINGTSAINSSRNTNFNNLVWTNQLWGPFTVDTGISFASSAGKIAYYDTSGVFKGWIPVMP